MRDTNALNTILYGPPGTGKTYKTISRAVEIIDGQAGGNYDKVLERYRELIKNGRIAFTTFHQSYGYEEFIEGIKPVSDNTTSGDIKYNIKPGIFKEFCDKAAFDNNTFSSKAIVWKVSLDGSGRKKSPLHKVCLDDNCIRIDGNDDKTSDDIILKRFKDDMKEGDIVLSCYTNKEIDAVGVVSGECEYKDEYNRLKYCRAVKWVGRWKGDKKYDIYAINNNTLFSQQAVYRLNNISVDNVISILNDPNNPPTVLEKIEYNYNKDKQDKYVFIIDEINRGNVSKIFGELITLIEPTKRLGAKEEMRCKLPYSKTEFGVPKNVYILGTMNTADRSLVQLDAALRRRFEFEEMMPDYKVIEEKVGEVGGINIAEMLTAINERITVLLDREHQIGHSYFMKLKKENGATATVDELADIFRNSIIPLLQEYFFDDYELIRKVLGANDFVIEKKKSKYLNFDSAKEIYEINSEKDDSENSQKKDVFKTPEQYKQIYEKVSATTNETNE